MTTTAHSPSVTRMSAVSLQGVSRSYGSGPAEVRALRAVDIDFPRGSWTAVMGPSGSGKSTLLHTAAGLERPDAGRVALGDTDLSAASEDQLTALRRSRIGFVFQSFNLIASLTAEENVSLPLRLAGRAPSAAEVQQVLASVGLEGRGRHKPRELSGGQQQRVAIARAMITHPEVLFADEPTGALDSTAARSVLELMRSMADQGQTIIMVTHDPSAAARADSTVFLRDGQIVDHLTGADTAAVAARLVSLEA